MSNVERAATVERFVAALVASRAASAAAASVGDRRRQLLGAEAGVGPGAGFDLASLTKPLMATLALVLERRGVLALGQEIGAVWPGARPPLARRRLEDLLRHRSGLPAWAPLRLLSGSRSSDDVADLLVRRLPARREATTEYSDLGYILWGLAAERVTGRALADLVAESVCAPLDLRTIAPGARQGSQVVRTVLDGARETELAAAGPWRRRLPVNPPPRRGQTQDGNARFLGRLCGHAGLFGSAADLDRVGREWLAPGRLLRPEDVERALAGREEYALGWARRRVWGSAGPALGERAFGHTGFTGTSVWIDPDGERILVLLAHRTSAGSDFNRFRRAFHALAVESVSRR